MTEQNPFEALNLISSWAKWLTTVETGVIAFIGSLFLSDQGKFSWIQKVFGVSTVFCFGISIMGAAMLLWTLPEIAQYLKPGVDIWTTEDSVAKQLFHLNTQGFAIVETVGFIIGLVSFALLIICLIIQPSE